MIETEEPIQNVPSVKFGRAEVKIGENVTFAGYGRFITMMEEAKNRIGYFQVRDATRRYGNAILADSAILKGYKTEELAPGVLEKIPSENHIVSIQLNNQGLPMHPLAGDSGGPLVANIRGEKSLIGVASGYLSYTDVEIQKSEYFPFMIFAKIGDNITPWINKIVSTVKPPNGESKDAKEFISCNMSDGQSFMSYLVRDKQNKLSVQSSKLNYGLSAAEVVGFIETELNEIFVNLSGGKLKLMNKDFAVGRVLVKRNKDYSDGAGVYWGASTRIEAIDEGRYVLLQPPRWFVYGLPGSFTGFVAPSK
ncbi:MAG: hypothetical protein ING65_05260 [Rhodocyclaceae bacterium]|nr:hypothetical protein [Rhodocyclaceae bacterium]